MISPARSPVIPVAFATANDCEYTCVAVSSILQKSSPSAFYRFVILVPSDFSESSREKMHAVTDPFENCSLEIVDMKDAFRDAYQRVKHINNMTYYRLMLPSILSECDKCIYLDSDIIVCGDLRDLYETEVDGFYVAGVKAPGYMHREDIEIYCRKSGLPSMDRYINAGVLLMNLKEIRADGTDQRFLECAARVFEGQDQDIVNVTCYEKILHLPYRFNFMTKYASWPMDMFQGIFTEREVQEAWERPLVIHYADKVKPWDDFSLPMAQRWWAALKDSAVWAVCCEEKKEMIFRRLFSENRKIDHSRSASDCRLEAAQKELEQLRSSVSFRFGRAATWLPRKMRGAVRCVRQHGLLYTARRVLIKICGK